MQNSKSQLSDGFARWRLEQVWPTLVGETIAAQTMPCSYSNGTLYIWVRHSTWLQQMWFFKEVIKEKVNKHLGYGWVKQVRFTLEQRAATALPGQDLDSDNQS